MKNLDFIDHCKGFPTVAGSNSTNKNQIHEFIDKQCVWNHWKETLKMTVDKLLLNYSLSELSPAFTSVFELLSSFL